MRSALGQGDAVLEVIVVDDGSVDGCERVLAERADPRVELVVHDRPRGAAEARNTGVGRARGEWVAFLDDDDVWAPGFVAASLAALGGAPACAWCCTGTVQVDTSWRIVGASAPPDPRTIETDLFSTNVVPTTSCVVASRDLLDKVGPWDPAFPLFQDWDYWLRLAPLSPLATVERPLVAYRHHGGNMTGDASRWRAEMESLREKHGAGAEPPAGSSASRERAAAWNYLQAGRRRDSVREMWKVARQFRDWRAATSMAAIAVAPGAMARADLARRRRQVPPDWASEAEAWLAPLRRQ